MIKAEAEEKLFHWKEAAEAYEKLASLKANSNKEDELNYLRKAGKNYQRAGDSAENNLDFIKLYNKGIDVFTQLSKLSGELGNEAEIFEAEGEIHLIKGIISPTEPAKVEFKLSYETFKKAHLQYSNNNNVKGSLRCLSRIYFSGGYFAHISSRSEYTTLKDIYDVWTSNYDLLLKLFSLSKSTNNYDYLPEGLYGWMNCFMGVSHSINFKEESFKREWSKKNEELRVFIEDIKNDIENITSDLDQAYFFLAACNTICGYAFQYADNDLEQRRLFNKAYEYNIKSLQKSLIVNSKTLIILNLFWLNWWALFGGRFELIQKRILKDVKDVIEISKIYGNINVFCLYHAYLLPAFLFGNMSQMKYFSVKRKRNYAQQALEYSLKLVKLVGSLPISSWVYQMIIWCYSSLIYLASNSSERQTLSKEILDHVKKLSDVASQYNGGFIKSTSYSSAYKAYKTLADTSESEKEHVEMLEKAINAQKSVQEHAIESRTGTISTSLRLGLLQQELGILSGNIEPLKDALETLQKAVEDSNIRKYHSYSATGYEYLALIEDRLGNHSESANYYISAKLAHEESLKDVGYDLIKKKIYEKIDYAQAWHHIETAKAHHKKDLYAKAREEYEKGSNILEGLANYQFEAPYYRAWTIQEEAELLSKEERHDETIRKYEETRAAFKKALEYLKEGYGTIKETTRQDKILKLEKVAELRMNYSDARISLENGKFLSKKGDHLPAADHFASAASLFRKICCSYRIERERTDLEAVYYLCRAWESMELAEHYEDPERFSEASELFNKASKQFYDNKMKLLASGNAAFCLALENGIRFDEAFDRKEKEELYPKIKIMLRRAASSYQKGGYNDVADWAVATSTYFDASWHLIKADEEMNLTEKKRLLDMGTEILASAAELFRKAGYAYKEKEILERIGLVKKEEKILLSALSTIREPSISRSTLGIHAPSCPVETSVSPRLSDAQEVTEETQRIEGKRAEMMEHKRSKSGLETENIPVEDTFKELEQTEKEVSVEAQKIMCIVHKGPIDGTVYICPNCKTYYCLTCAYSLKAKGEKCWSCEKEIKP